LISCLWGFLACLLLDASGELDSLVTAVLIGVGTALLLAGKIPKVAPPFAFIPKFRAMSRPLFQDPTVFSVWSAVCFLAGIKFFDWDFSVILRFDCRWYRICRKMLVFFILVFVGLTITQNVPADEKIPQIPPPFKTVMVKRSANPHFLVVRFSW